ncbi:DUF4249 domain-containing protein [Spirosoma knui]
MLMNSSFKQVWEQGRYWAFGLALLVVGSCVDPYRPQEISAPNRYLVVDGFLNGGSGATVIKLSRTQNIQDFKKPAPETKALVRVEGEGSGPYALTEGPNGTYTLESPALTVGRNYRVRIKTADGQEYLSDAVTVKKTPKIDSLSWSVQNDGLQVFVNTHDATNRTRYYRWEYEDTYEIQTPYQSPFELVDDSIVERKVTNINRCWQTQLSTNIIIGSTARLTQDVLQRSPILFIPGSSPKLWIKYSLMVKQYAQSPEGYAYWENLQKNTEQLGSLFDPLPSQVTGNLHNVANAAEPVLGFIDGYSVEQVRVFIDRPAALPRSLINTGYETCKLDTIPFPLDPTPLKDWLGPSGGYNAVELLAPGVYLAAAVGCTDCRNRGTTTKPSFWP